MQSRPQFVAILAVVAFGTLANSASAAERVLLANGFDLRCDHHRQVGSVIRLFMGSSETSYMDFQPAEIRSFEPVPDPPRVPATRPEATDAKLSPSDLHQLLAAAGREHNLDVDLLASVVHAESAGNAYAVSRAGARGLMQLMPRTAAEQGVQDSFRADENVRGGSAYLDELLVRYHDNLALALAAYNAGPATVDKYGGIPPYHETRAYVARVIHEFNRRARAREIEARRSQSSSAAQVTQGR